MKLSKEAKEGLEYAAREIKTLMAGGIHAQNALRITGIEGLEDTYYFLSYLRESGQDKLLKKITKSK